MSPEEKIMSTDFYKDFNPIVQKYTREGGFLETCPVLVGGAVIDILENREPKDYDFCGTRQSTFIKILVSNGARFIHSTKSAETYIFKEYKLQFLENSIHDFEFKISQSTFNFKTGKVEIHEISFNRKILIPVSFIGKQAWASLRRIPHWRKKGYTIEDLTYYSLLNSVNKDKSEKLES